MTFYNHISESLKKRKLFALQVDPDKHNTASLIKTARYSNVYDVDFLLVGGSLVSTPIDETIKILKAETDKPVIIFPGNILQISELADGILLLCLISGRNPEYLIGNHVVAAPLLKRSRLEIIPTGYILIENGRSTSVEYISNTKPIPADKTDLAVATAMAGEMLGHRLLYLEAGSGAYEPVKTNLISEVKKNIQIPLIVGGGIQHPDQIRKIFLAGADIIVVGTAIEKNADMIPVLADAVRNLPSMQ
ncbi:MAG: geranylgeranylglyceryl/heptaprenylglyceryl phosphate synthase [Bacteroidales bacterium]|nr:geranylgeranylglyceryl/heptaprenylglyceryl phosphate synthase [Bacteroidales bacterium]